MNLLDLQPQFIKSGDKGGHSRVIDLSEADGILFLCPKCFAEKGSNIGVHSIICWNPSVPQTISPKPGRWQMLGTGFNDLTLKAGSSSILLKGGCNAHFFITDGKIRMT